MTGQSRIEIGRDSTTLGRWFRLVLGLLLILFASLRTISITDRVDALPLILTFLAILVVYYLAYLVLEKSLLARNNPWLNMLVFVVPALVIALVPVFPATIQAGMILYLGVTSVLNAMIGYGGCEVLAVPTLVYQRRYDVYCPCNVLDLAEQAVRPDNPLQPKGHGR